MAFVPDSLPDSQSLSNHYADYGLEATQLSQPHPHSQAQSQGFRNSQTEPRLQYWGILIPTNPNHDILKLPWSKPRLQIGRGAHKEVGNDVVLHEKRISNRHCRISLAAPGQVAGAGLTPSVVQALKEGDAEPEVWVEDLRSSNGTFINGTRLKSRWMLQHGDEISLGHLGTAENHEVRYIFRSVGRRGSKLRSVDQVGQVYERYQFLATLGKGTFAEVKRAVDIETGDLRAIKQIVKHRFANQPQTLELFQREIDICTTLTHENICRLIEWYEDPQHICLVLEYVDGGDLLDYIMSYEQTGGAVPEAEAIDFTWQICRAMAYCHESGVTHRDLKPENILLTRGSSTQGRTVKIADFGLAKMVQAGTMLKSLVGTPQYLAPEVVMQSRNQGYENVVDSWSIGIIVYSMLTRQLPFEDDPELTMEQRIRMRYTMDWDRAPLVDFKVSDAAADFIGRLLERDPRKRMSVSDALEHPWLTTTTSSLPCETQSDVLGGDSMWNIQSFDSDDWQGDDDLFSHAGDRELDDLDLQSGNGTSGGWDRPMTKSMTNLASSRQSSEESFSQPMEKLRLNTATHQIVVDQNENAKPDENGTAMPPLQPLLTPPVETPPRVAPLRSAEASAMDLELESAEEPEREPEPASEGISKEQTVTAMKVEAKPAEPAPHGQAIKRKQGSQWFSSGSLSPPPVESQPKAPKVNGRADSTPGADGSGSGDGDETASAGAGSGAQAGAGTVRRVGKRLDRETTPRAIASTARLTRSATARATQAPSAPTTPTTRAKVRAAAAGTVTASTTAAPTRPSRAKRSKRYSS